MSKVCVLFNSARKDAESFIDWLSQQDSSKKEKLGIDLSNEEAKKMTAKSMAAILQVWLGKEEDDSKREAMSSDYEGMFKMFCEYFTNTTVNNQDDFNYALDNYDIYTNQFKTPFLYFSLTEEGSQELYSILKDMGSNRIMSDIHDDKGNVIAFACVMCKPKMSDSASRQATVIQKLENLRQKALDDSGNPIKPSKKTVKDSEGKEVEVKTYFYNGQTIETKSVSEVVHGSKEYTGPAAAAPIGTITDALVRDFFDNRDNFFTDGQIDETKLEEASAQYGNIFTVEALRSMLTALKNFEENVRSKPGFDNAVFYTKEVKLFQKVLGQNYWITGTPDMIIVDNYGTLHIVDFKTKLVNDAESYEDPIANDEYGTFTGYQYQTSIYVQLLQTNGFKVESDPYIMLFDTYYDGADKEGSRTNTYYIEKWSKPLPIITLSSGQVLNDYVESFVESHNQQAEANKTPNLRIESTEDLRTKGAFNPNVNLLFMPPAFHNNQTKDYSFGSLAGTGLFSLSYMANDVNHKPVTFEYPVLSSLSVEDQQSLEWFFDGKPETSSQPSTTGMLVLMGNSIFGRPDIVSRTEIRSLADIVAFNMSKTITSLMKGEEVDGIELSKSKDGKSSPLKGFDRGEIIERVGINSLFSAVIDCITGHADFDCPTLEEYETGNYDDDYEDKEDFLRYYKRVNTAKLVKDHLREFMELCGPGFKKYEGKVIGVVDEDGSQVVSTGVSLSNDKDNQNLKVLEDLLEGLSDREAWTFGELSRSVRESLSVDVRRVLANMTARDTDGNPITNSIFTGLSMPINLQDAVNLLSENLSKCDTVEEMMNVMQNLAKHPANNWLNELIQFLNYSENMKAKFFLNFRKDQHIFSTCMVTTDDDGNRIVKTTLVNTKGALQTMIDSLNAAFTLGKVGSFEINGKQESLIARIDKKMVFVQHDAAHTVFDAVEEEVKSLKDAIKTAYKSAAAKNKETVAEEMGAKFVNPDDKDQIVKRLHKALESIGIYVDENIVYNYCLASTSTSSLSNNAYQLALSISNALTAIKNQSRTEKGMEKFRGEIFLKYSKVLEKIAPYVEEHVESSSYNNGKTYYTYGPSSFTGYTVRNLKNVLQDSNKFKKYMHDNYERYNWYFNGGQYMNDWLAKLSNLDVDNDKYREAFAHKTELSYIGKSYRELGPLSFQLSILHNYFGSKSDEKEWAWFAVPTMSNKPSNEFIRMTKYERTEDGVNNEIVRNVLMPTFRQELNRIVDILYQFAEQNICNDQYDLTDKALKKAGMSSAEISQLKKDLSNVKSENETKKRSISKEQLKAVLKAKSGAKFHFLWYLNYEADKNDAFLDILVNKINTLLNGEEISIAEQTGFDDTVREIIIDNMKKIVEAELKHMEDIGLMATKKVFRNGKTYEVLQYQEEFGDKLGKSTNDVAGSLANMKEELTDYIWQDIAANINIIQITGIDLAYYGNSVAYQKRIAQMHSSGTHLAHTQYDDGHLRSITVKDSKIRNEGAPMLRKALEGYLNEHRKEMSQEAAEEYQQTIEDLVKNLTDTEATDGQSLTSPTAIRKKLADQGEWTEARQRAYERILKGDLSMRNIEELVLGGPAKPFVYATVAMYSGSPTTQVRRVPVQQKNSEYMILLADALARGTGRNKLAALFDFMEQTAKMHDKQGIDTIHFASVVKVGNNNSIDLDEFDKDFERRLANNEVKEGDYNKELTKFMLDKIDYNSTPENVKDGIDKMIKDGKLYKEEVVYNPQYVTTIDLEHYIIQQTVPEHLQEHEQSYGSQIRILGITDITPDTHFTVNGKDMEDKVLVNEYMKLHADNIRDSYDRLLSEMGFRKNAEGRVIPMSEMTPEQKSKALLKLSALLQRTLMKDDRYNLDARNACKVIMKDGLAVDFVVPLYDPIQSTRIQELLFSIVKNNINKQMINGGPVVQANPLDENLHIRFKDNKGNQLPTLPEYLRKNPSGTQESYKQMLVEKNASIDYFECYMPVPNKEVERLITKEDGTLMTMEEIQSKLPKNVFDDLVNVIGYRIPTEDKYSMLPLRIVGFTPREAGQVIVMPQEIVFLTGSDYDIDKMYIMLKNFNSMIDYLEKEISDKSSNQTLADEFNKECKKTLENDLYYSGILQDIGRVRDNILDILDGKNVHTLDGIKGEHQTGRSGEILERFINWYKGRLLSKALMTVDNINSRNVHTRIKSRFNRIMDLQRAVLTNADTLPKMMNPNGFDNIKKAARIVEVLRSGSSYEYEDLQKMSIDELDELLDSADPHNVTLTSSKIYFQKQNMQGTQLVGTFANHNASHGFLSFQKLGIDLSKVSEDRIFTFDGRTVGDPFNPTVLDSQRGFDGMLISKSLASLLAAAVDTAKDPVLASLNINPQTASICSVMCRLGFNIASIGMFLSQPVIREVCETYSRNNLDSWYTLEMAITAVADKYGIDMNDHTLERNSADMFNRSNFAKHLNDDLDNSEDLLYQGAIMRVFSTMNIITTSVNVVTKCTKFNSVSNAGGPHIEETKILKDKVDSIQNDSKETQVFFDPTGSNKGYTYVRDVIENNPILEAFYSCTIGENGAATMLMEEFFPQYYEGFCNLLSYVKESLNLKQVAAKQQRLLLSHYLFYILTERTEEKKAAIPVGNEYMQNIVEGIIERYYAVKEIKGRRPNMLLDSSLGGHSLRIRKKSDFNPLDTIVLSSGRLDSDMENEIMASWEDLITSDDPNLSAADNEALRRFGIDLFFYMLQKNAFTFSSSSMMNLSSVIVKYCATYSDNHANYIESLHGLKDKDRRMFGGVQSMHLDRFFTQFLRNNSKTTMLPRLLNDDPCIVSFEKGSFTVTGDQNDIPFNIRLNKDGDLKKYIRVAGKMTQFIPAGIYKLKNGSNTYELLSPLGLANNFVEYDANSELETSFFKPADQNAAEEEDSTEYMADSTEDDEDNGNEAELPMELQEIIAAVEHDESIDSATKVGLLETLNAGNTTKVKDFSFAVKAAIQHLKNEQPEIEQKMQKIYKEQNKC